MREAIVTLSDSELEALGFRDLVAECRDAGIRDVEMFEDDGYSCAPQVEVERPLDEDVLAELECVDDWELLAEADDSYLYLLELTAADLPEDTTEAHADLLGACEANVTERGILLSMVGDQEAIRGMLRSFESAGATPDLRKLAAYEGSEDTLDALTDRQREVIETAYDMGFYEVPRQATTDDVATELDIDAGTVSEHLQRAERNLLARQLAV